MASAADKLRELGYEVQEITEYHFRVERVFDFWLPRGKWWYRVDGRRGQKPLDQIPFFVQTLLGKPGDHDVPCEQAKFVDYLVGIGWNKTEAEAAWNERQSQAKSCIA